MWRNQKRKRIETKRVNRKKKQKRLPKEKRLERINPLRYRKLQKK